MEEKNVTKISLSTFFLILAIIAIIVMGIFIYKINNDKTAEIQKSIELQAQENSLNGTVSDLQEKNNNTINDNSSTSNSETISSSSGEKVVFKKGIYKHDNTIITFEDSKFEIKLDDQFVLDGQYEILNDKTAICNISSYTFLQTEDIVEHKIDKNQKWDISFNIKNEKTLEVKDINVPKDELEIIITIYNLIEPGNVFSLLRENSNEKEIISGKWYIVSAVNGNNAMKITNMSEIFGSSYQKKEYYLELNENGTFVDTIISSIDKNKSNKGTYKVENDFYKIGDCHIFFTYSDGSEMELKRVYYDESYTSYLPYNITKDGVYYELHLRK